MTSDAPSTFLVFGAAGHIGAPATEWLAKRKPDAELRLVTSRPEKAAALETDHPRADVRIANYLSAEDMSSVFEGIESAFVVTPDFLDETVAMTNVATAIERAGTVSRLIRLIGDPPGVRDESEIEAEISGYDAGTAVQHLRARKTLGDHPDVPVVFMNICAWFMADFATFLRPPIVERRTLVMPFDRMMNFIDTRDIGRAAAELMLDPSRTEVGQTYHLHNGIDTYPFSQIAELMTEVFGETIDYDGTEEAFLRDLGPMFRSYMGREDAAEYFLEYLRFEKRHVERLGADLTGGEPQLTPEMLGFEARPFAAWLAANRDMFQSTSQS